MRILLADDQNEVRSALKILLEQEAGLEVAGETAELNSLADKAVEVEPDVILLDWELGYLKVENVIPVLHGILPDMKIIAMSCRPEASKEALAAGADAFVSKGDHPEILLETVKSMNKHDNN